MNVTPSSVFAVVTRFPGHKEKVKRLFRNSGTFRALCHDYSKCAAAIEYWSDKTAGEAPARRKEYRELLEKLEEELVENLNQV